MSIQYISQQRDFAFDRLISYPSDGRIRQEAEVWDDICARAGLGSLFEQGRAQMREWLQRTGWPS
jgi:hypothetical protein